MSDEESPSVEEHHRRIHANSIICGALLRHKSLNWETTADGRDLEVVGQHSTIIESLFSALEECHRKDQDEIKNKKV